MSKASFVRFVATRGGHDCRQEQRGAPPSHTSRAAHTARQEGFCGLRSRRQHPAPDESMRQSGFTSEEPRTDRPAPFPRDTSACPSHHGRSSSDAVSHRSVHLRSCKRPSTQEFFEHLSAPGAECSILHRPSLCKPLGLLQHHTRPKRGCRWVSASAHNPQRRSMAPKQHDTQLHPAATSHTSRRFPVNSTRS